MVFFYLVTTGGIFDISLLCENLIEKIHSTSIIPLVEFAVFSLYKKIRYSEDVSMNFRR